MDISIHAPRAGSDRDAAIEEYNQYLISIHAPRAGSDVRLRRKGQSRKLFQSTLPVRGATFFEFF